MENASTNEADINCAPGEGGTTPLYAVCSMGAVGMVQLLLDGNADPNLARKKNGETPLYTACDSGRVDVARLLLEYNADIDGETLARRRLLVPAHRCVSSSLLRSRSPSLASHRPLSPPHRPLSSPSPLPPPLPARVPPPSGCTTGGTSALMVACHKGHGSVARLLLDSGARTGEAKAGRGTALISAATMGHADCVRMLVDEGNEADLDVSFQSLTALQWAESTVAVGEEKPPCDRAATVALLRTHATAAEGS